MVVHTGNYIFYKSVSQVNPCFFANFQTHSHKYVWINNRKYFIQKISLIKIGPRQLPLGKPMIRLQTLGSLLLFPAFTTTAAYSLPRWISSRLRDFMQRANYIPPCACAGAKCGAITRRAPRHIIGHYSKNPPKIRLKNSWNWLIILTACNSLTHFEHEAHAFTGNGNDVNLLNIIVWK